MISSCPSHLDTRLKRTTCCRIIATTSRRCTQQLHRLPLTILLLQECAQFLVGKGIPEPILDAGLKVRAVLCELCGERQQLGEKLRSGSCSSGLEYITNLAVQYLRFSHCTVFTLVSHCTVCAQLTRRRRYSSRALAA